MPQSTKKLNSICYPIWSFIDSLKILFYGWAKIEHLLDVKIFSKVAALHFKQLYYKTCSTYLDINAPKIEAGVMANPI